MLEIIKNTLLEACLCIRESFSILENLQEMGFKDVKWLMDWIKRSEKRIKGDKGDNDKASRK